jgi:hypothetical protein
MRETKLLGIVVSILGLGVDALSYSIEQTVHAALQGNFIPILLRPPERLRLCFVWLV